MFGSTYRQMGAMFAVMGIGLVMLVLTWQQADTLVLSFDARCVYNGADGPEPFASVYDDSGKLPKVPYSVVQYGTSTVGCSVLNSLVSTDFVATTTPETLSGTNLTLLPQVSPAVDYRIASTTWETAPEFIGSRSQYLFARFPQAFFAVLTLAALVALVAHHWLGSARYSDKVEE